MPYAVRTTTDPHAPADESELPRGRTSPRGQEAGSWRFPPTREVCGPVAGHSGSLTRQQPVTILYRFAGRNGYDTAARADLSGYPDVGTVADYAAEAMAWAAAEGIIGGTTQGTLNPGGTASRAQFAAILYRWMA